MLLTGGPASGKSATAAELAKTLPRVAVIDVDDIRHLVVAGHAAPWDGDEGVLQQRIGVENSCDLARRFLGAGIEVVMADVFNDATAALYRRLVPSVVIVRLRLPLREGPTSCNASSPTPDRQAVRGSARDGGHEHLPSRS